MLPFRPKKVETLDQLVKRWRNMLVILGTMVKKDETPDDQKEFIKIAGAQLAKCIDELEKVMYGDPARTAVSKALANALEINDSIGRVTPGNSAGVEPGNQG